MGVERHGGDAHRQALATHFGVDLVLECTGKFLTPETLQGHLDRGAKRVIVAAPVKVGDVLNIVVGVNHHLYEPSRHHIVTAASCTTNAIVPVLTILDAAFGIDHALMTTLHSVMNDQPPIDGYHHADLRRTRSAMQSIIPVATGLARGVARLLPQLADRVEAKSIRVPVTNVSAIDLVATLARPTTVAGINACLQQAVAASFPGQLAYTAEAHASVDFNHSAYSAIIDASQTRMSGPQLANLLIWFDNEWGFANRMLELAAFWGSRLTRC